MGAAYTDLTHTLQALHQADTPAARKLIQELSVSTIFAVPQLVCPPLPPDLLQLWARDLPWDRLLVRHADREQLQYCPPPSQHAAAQQCIRAMSLNVREKSRTIRTVEEAPNGLRRTREEHQHERSAQMTAIEWQQELQRQR